MVDEALYEYMRLQLELTTSSFHRYLYERVNWTSRMIAITGGKRSRQIHDDPAIS